MSEPPNLNRAPTTYLDAVSLIAELRHELQRRPVLHSVGEQPREQIDAGLDGKGHVIVIEPAKTYEITLYVHGKIVKFLQATCVHTPDYRVEYRRFDPTEGLPEIVPTKVVAIHEYEWKRLAIALAKHLNRDMPTDLLNQLQKLDKSAYDEVVSE